MSLFKLWSQTQPDAASALKPDFGTRNWDALSEDDKHIMWKHLEWYFFDKNVRAKGDGWGNANNYYEFLGDSDLEKEMKRDRVAYSIMGLTQKYKAKNYAPNFLEKKGLSSACLDFLTIFAKRPGYVVLELLSLYCRVLLSERAKAQPTRIEGEKEKDFIARVEIWRYKDFDDFSGRLNEIFNDFGIDVILTRQGFVPRQEEVILERVYFPTLKALSGKRWEKVNECLEASFSKYREKDYGTSITEAISGVQAYLQLLVVGEVGKGNISWLMKEASKKSLIPTDVFSQEILKNLESIFAKERQTKAGVHPRTMVPTENNARLILNLAMVFLQHCLQSV